MSRLEDEPELSGWFDRICRVVFYAALLALAGFVVALVSNLTYLWPYGGNDEPMHLSMAHYIAEHLAWPPWDSAETERFMGISYATSPSLNYWFEGLLLKSTGYDRLSQLLLFCVCLSVFVCAARKNPLAGLLALALIVPQAVFVFSYLNSDAWTATVALLLGVAVDAFVANPTKTKNIVALFAAAAACLTCRYHLWAIGFVAFAVPLLSRLRLLMKENPRALIAATAIGLAIASWWPVTSFLANDGDPIGFSAARSERLLFAQPHDPSFMMVAPRFDPADFAERLGKSLYGWWGWSTIALPYIYYKAALLIGLPLAGFAILRHSHRAGLIVLLLLVNLGLMLWRASTYHYVLWQGRYLFPALFISIGILVHRESVSSQLRANARMAWFAAAWCTVVIGLNLSATAELYARSGRAETRAATNPPHLRAQMMLHSGKRVAARELFLQAVREDPEDHMSHNALGYMAIQDGDLAAARLHLEQAKSLDPDDSHVRLNLGALRLAEDDIEGAVEELREAVGRYPDSAVLHYFLSTAYERQQDYGSALRHCQRAIRLNPHDPAAQEQLKSLLERTVDAAKANQ